MNALNNTTLLVPKIHFEPPEPSLPVLSLYVRITSVSDIRGDTLQVITRCVLKREEWLNASFLISFVTNYFVVHL